MADVEALDGRMARLENRLGLVEDREAIERLQYQYGFYLDNRMWDEIVELFADTAPSIEIGQRGSYVGKARMRRFLCEVLGGGRWGLLKDEIIHHIQLQPLITVADDRRTARMRSRALIQGNSPPGSGKMLLAEGLYENTYVKEDDVWKIQRIWWVPTYYFQVAGFDGAVFDSGPESTDFPPDRPSPPRDEALGRRFPPFHYSHPFTGAATPSPSTRKEGWRTMAFDQTQLRLAGDVPGRKVPEALHIGSEDRPFADDFGAPGVSLQLLQADVEAGTFAVRIRFAAGTQLPPHHHTGVVFAYTLAGEWSYLEYPDSPSSRAGSYLYEPPGSVHTLKVADSNTGLTDVVFVITGAMLILDGAGNVAAVLNAASHARDWPKALREQGKAVPEIIGGSAVRYLDPA